MLCGSVCSLSFARTLQNEHCQQYYVSSDDKAIGIPNEVIHSVVKQQCLYEKLVMVYSICMKSDITFASVAARIYMYEFGR